MRDTMIGLDIAKRKMFFVVQDGNGRTLSRRSCRSEELLRILQSYDRCEIGIEACGGSSFWARRLRKLGFTVRLLSAVKVAKLRTRQKNDYNDCEAIIELMRKVNTKFIGINEIWQQDIQTLHRIRSSCVERRVELINQIHGFALEYGVVLPESMPKFRKELLLQLENAENELSQHARVRLHKLYREICALEKEEADIQSELEEIADSNEDCQRLRKVPGVGVLTATAFLAAIGDPRNFKNGREASAWLGLVPRQFTTGGKPKLGRISKRGDSYVRQLLVHGGRSVLIAKERIKRQGQFYERITRIERERGFMKAAIAVANRNARVMLAILKNQTEYQMA